MKNYMKQLLALTFSLLLPLGAAQAATFTYGAVVTDYPSPANIPGDPATAPVGTPGTVTLFIDDSDPSLLLFDPGPASGVFSASVSVPGFFSGAVTFVDFLSSFIATAEYLQFVSYGPTMYDDIGSYALSVPDGYHRVRVDYGTPLASAPVTVGDVVAALAAPGETGFFRHEIVLVNPSEGGVTDVIQTRVDFGGGDVPAVPLPAAAWMLLAGLSGLALLRARG